MTLTRFHHPDLVKDFTNDVFLKNLNDHFFNKHNFSHGKQEPDYEVVEEEKEFLLEVAVPGMSKKDIDVEIDNGILTIATKERKEEDKRKGFAAVEFYKNFQLSKKINQDKITAKVDNGLLSICLPKVDTEVKKPTRKIDLL